MGGLTVTTQLPAHECCDRSWHPAGERCWTLFRAKGLSPELKSRTLARLPELRQGDFVRITADDAELRGEILAVTERRVVALTGDGGVAVLDLELGQLIVV